MFVRTSEGFTIRLSPSGLNRRFAFRRRKKKEGFYFPFSVVFFTPFFLEKSKLK